MRKEIYVPLKCSTAKKIYNSIDYLTFRVFIVECMVSLAAITYMMYNGFVYGTRFLFDGYSSGHILVLAIVNAMAAVMGIILICMFIEKEIIPKIIQLCKAIIEHIPKFKCIPDSGAKP
jgi:hypothetical protein